MEVFEIFIFLRNKNIKRLLKSEIVWLAFPTERDDFLDDLRSSSLYLYNGGRQWWREDKFILFENSHK